jgi:hypothetical protein
MHSMAYSCVIGANWGDLSLCRLGRFILVPNGAICHSAKWADFVLGAKWGDYNTMPIGAISGSWSRLHFMHHLHKLRIFISFIRIWFLTFMW